MSLYYKLDTAGEFKFPVAKNLGQDYIFDFSQVAALSGC
jgi:hypothetical protein